MTQLTEHFSREEMQCPCCKACEMDNDFMEDLELMRSRFDRPLKINSGYRCQKHNDSLPNSSSKSWHTKGKAADISWDEFSAEDKYKLLTHARINFEGLGIAKTYIHVDHGDIDKLWIY